MPVEAPAIPAVDRTTVPVSALFSDAERAMPENPTPAARENDLALPVTAPAKSASPTKAAEDTPAPTITPTKPADETPATAKPAEATPAPTKPADAAPAPETKIKIGDKEYTKQELEQALAARTAQSAPAPAAAVAPAPVPVKPPTPEEIATAESAWCEKFVADEKLTVPVTEKEMEAILTGDKDGVALLSGKLNSVVAKAVMLARKSIYQELNPIIGGLQNNLQPVLQNQQQVEAAAAEHQFFSAYPDFRNHADTVRRVGDALLTRFPNECRAMTREQLLQEVAAQSDRIIQAECSRFAPGKTWRELQQAVTPAPAVVPAPVAAQPAPVPAASAPAPTIKAPGANSPASTGTGTDGGKNWHKETAASLTN